MTASSNRPPAACVINVPVRSRRGALQGARPQLAVETDSVLKRRHILLFSGPVRRASSEARRRALPGGELAAAQMRAAASAIL